MTEVFPESRNLIVWIFRIFLLVLKLGLWAVSTARILVFERQLGGREGEVKVNAFRKEPPLWLRRAAS